MNYWLVKSEPIKYSWEKFLKDGSTFWDGVRNYTARIHLRGMKKGDLVLFYHSNVGLCVVGIAKVIKEHYQDPTTTEDWSAVDLAPHETFTRPVTLQEMKKDARLQNIGLIKIGRLSVMPLTREEFDIIVDMSEKD